ncbi:MAG: sugar phosphate isomerase/epimerase [Verrucomicrobiae bacterium]|nr:sugar phosphate isomerase/epimerase [Verrucomicrobiae bacterium]
MNLEPRTANPIHAMAKTTTKKHKLKPVTPLPIGMLVRLGNDPLEAFERVQSTGFKICQLACPPDDYLFGENAENLTRKTRTAMKKNGIQVHAVFLSFKNQVWNKTQGPGTVGFMPEKTRAPRMARACMIANWANKIGVKTLIAHVGFIPPNTQCAAYKDIATALRAFVEFCESNGQIFLFETGQETVAVLKQVLLDIGRPNIGVNLDPANLLLYGMDDPLLAVKELHPWIKGVHAKDGCRPVKDGDMGVETPLGDGQVDFPRLMEELRRHGYRGPMIIEREITGPQQQKDILKAKKILENINNGYEKNNQT